MARPKQIPGLAPRLVAIDRLRAVLRGAAFAPLSADEVADSRDRALANRLVTIALRRHQQLTMILDELLDRGMPSKSGSFEAAIRLSLAQLIFLPDLGAHSAIFLGVEAIKADNRAQHLAKLANAVLRRAQSNAARYWSQDEVAVLPKWLGRRWAAAYGADILPAFATALIEGAPLDLTLRDEGAELIEELRAAQLVFDSVRVGEREVPVSGLPGYAEGRFWVQDVAAAIPARLVGLPAGASVLDLCAAPGGKTAQLAKAGYRVTALDSDGQRLVRLRENLDRLGYQAEIVEADAASYAPVTPFDAVLLDAPCSATGIFRRHPEVLVNRSPADIADRVALQRRLIANAVRCLNPGGVLIYCVCSLEPEEAEAQARHIASLEGMESLPIRPAEVGIEGAIGSEGFVRTHPALGIGELAGMDGFFVARYKKRLA